MLSTLKMSVAHYLKITEEYTYLKINTSILLIKLNCCNNYW